jgi:hypothetical protein
MTWTGDISKMGKLVDRLGDLARVPSRIAAKASVAVADLIEAEFAAGDDPYGDPWAPLAESTVARGRTPPPLTDEGDMRESVVVRPMRGSGIAITIDHPAAPHQTGWSGPRGDGPARPILPARSTLPESWKTAINGVARKEIGV